jgi:hypothetical protein
VNGEEEYPDLLACRPCGLVFAPAWGLKDHQIRGCLVDEPPAKRCKREDDGVEGTLLRSGGNQQASEARVIRFWCSCDRIEKFAGSFFWEMKCHPVCPFSIARVRVDDETLDSVLYSDGESTRTIPFTIL